MLTEEQKRVVFETFLSEEAYVNAFAGTGKTTTCMAVLRQANSMNLRSLYLVFNRAMAEEAKNRATKQGIKADILTVHSLAFRELSKRGYFKNRELRNLRVKDISQALSLDYTTSFWVLEFFNQLLFSHYSFSQIEEFISDKVSSSRYFQLGLEKTGSELPLYLTSIIRLIRENALPTPHDFYLKEYALSGLPEKLSYDLVILDEAQDANPLFIQLIQKIPARHRLFVGDRHQKIYTFRGTVDASHYMKNPRVLYLTKTFRFTSHIAEHANTVLKFKSERKSIQPSDKPAKSEKPSAILSRTNSKLLQYYLELPDRKSVAFERDIREVIKPVLSIIALKERLSTSDLDGLSVDYSILNAFSSYSDLKDYVYSIQSSQSEESLSEKEIIQAFNLSKNLDFKDILSILRDYQRFSQKPKELFLSTAHSSKGQEYNSVKLLSDLALPEEVLTDFRERLSQNLPQNPLTVSEINLLYVALTRATHSITLPEEISDCLSLMQELTYPNLTQPNLTLT